MLLIVVAILGGIVWWLFTSRQQGEEAAFAFAREAGLKLAVQKDRKFLDLHLGRDVQTRYPPSWRERLFDKLRQLGVASEEIDVTGEVSFTSQFFQPQGRFRVHLLYPNATKAELQMVVFNRHGLWQFNELNLVWYPPEQPGEPAPTEAAPAASPQS